MFGVRSDCPFAVAVVLGTAKVETFADVIGVELAFLLAVVQEAELAARIGKAHQIREKRILQRGIVDQHARMPVEVLVTLEKKPSQRADRLGQACKAEIERAETDRDEIERVIARRAK